MPPINLWLDLFPLEARAKIAWYVSSGKQNRHVLNLGMASHYQKEAVVEALSYSYTTDADTPYVALEWTQLFKDAIRTLVTNYQPTMFYKTDTIPYYRLKPLFSAPTLQQLHFNTSDPFIGPFLSTFRLRKVVLSLSCESPARPVTEIVASLNTEELSLVCVHTHVNEERCPLFRLGLLAANYRRFRSISVQCFCHDTGLWSLLRQVPDVEEICFSAEPPPDMYQRIKQVENIRLVRNHYSWQLIPKFAQKVIEVGPVILSDEKEASTLKQCSNLKSLDCELKNGAELAFRYFTNTFTSLRVLKLSWFRESNCFLCDLRSPRSSNDIYHASPGAMLNLIRNAPNIAELELNQVLIELEEQVEILKLLGNQLTRFSCTIWYDGERGFRYLRVVLKTLRRYNPRVTASNSRSLVFGTGTPVVNMVM